MKMLMIMKIIKIMGHILKIKYRKLCNKKFKIYKIRSNNDQLLYDLVKYLNYVFYKPIFI